MKRISSLLKLVMMLMSKKKIKEFFLMAEVGLMVFLITFTLVPISNALNLANGIEQVTSGSDLIYCVPSPSNSQPVPIREIQNTISSSYATTPEIYITQSSFCNIGPLAGKGYLILVSEDMYNSLNFELKKGELVNTQDEYLPVVISSHLANRYNIGDVMSCTINSSMTVLCKVSGILKSNSILVDVNKQEGSELTVDAVGFNMAKYNDDFVIAVTSSKMEISEEKVDAALFAFSQGTNIDRIIDELNETYINKYSFYSFNTLRNNTIKSSISDMDWRIVLLFLFSIVVVFNFIGYIVINTRQKQKILSIMNICGLSFRKSLVLNIVSLMIIVIPALLIGLIFSPFILINMDIEYYGFNVFLAGAIAFIFIGVVCVAAFTSMWQRKHMNTINQYKKG